jgi:hypothetical protein
MPGLHQEGRASCLRVDRPTEPDGAFLNAVRTLEDAGTRSLNVVLNQ